MKISQKSTKNEGYLINLLPLQFKYISRLWKNLIKKKTGKSVEIIDIYSSPNSQISKKDNFRIINSSLNRLIKDYGNENIVSLLSYIELNREFSRYINTKGCDLILEGVPIYLLPYTTSNLTIKDQKIIILGPDSNLSSLLDNKINSKLIFKKLKIETPQGKVVATVDSLFHCKKYPYFITGKFSSGAGQSALIANNLDIYSYISNLSSPNKQGPFLISQYIENVSFSMEISLFITHNKASIISITEDLKNNFESIGSLYPCRQTTNPLIIKKTQQIGEYLSRKGYRGPIGIGVFFDKNGKFYFSDINPRKQGFYGGDLLLTNNKLLEWEYSLYVKNIEPKIPNNFNPVINMGYSLVKNNSNFKIIKSPKDIVKNNEIFFWRNRSLVIGKTIGYVFFTALSREKLLAKISKKSNEFVKFTSDIHIHKNELVKAYWKLSGYFPKLEPIFTIFYEYAYSIFWRKGVRYCKSQESWLEAELEHLSKVSNINAKQTALFIGGGSLPYSAINFSKKLSKIDIFDKDIFAVLLSRRFLRKLKLEHKISVFYGDSLTTKNIKSNKYDYIYIASHLIGKLETVKKIVENNKNAIIVVRSGEGLLKKYEHSCVKYSDFKEYKFFNSVTSKHLYIYKNEKHI